MVSLKYRCSFILLVGVLIFSYYQFHSAPVYFNEANKARALSTGYATELNNIETAYNQALAGNDVKQAEVQRKKITKQL